MNILHLKYAIEVERTGSITKAAENLFMGQPNLSRSIKELEDSIGIKIFRRTSKGITPTIQGVAFLREAGKILLRFENLHTAYRTDVKKKINLTISAPRSSYLASAFAKTVAGLDDEKEVEINYKEASVGTVIENVVRGDSRIGIVRVREEHQQNLTYLLDSKELAYEQITKFKVSPITSKKNNISEIISKEEFENLIEIRYGDSFALGITKREEREFDGKKRIFVYDRASAFDLADSVPDSYMWMSDMHDSYLRRFDYKNFHVEGLSSRRYLDFLITKNVFSASLEERIFLDNVKLKKKSALSRV